MDIQAAKLDLVEKVLHISTQELIDKLNKILEREMVVAYTVDGKPLTQKDYNNRLAKGEKDIMGGNFSSQEDLENESETW